MAEFITNVAEIDYLRVASFNAPTFNLIEQIARYCSGTPDEFFEGKWRNYTGHWWSEDRRGFSGEGLQRHRKHMVAHMSGIWSPAFAASDFPQDTYCTRIDLQLTLPATPTYDAYSMAEKFDSADWHGRKKSPTIIKNFDKELGDTVAIGERGSPRYIRIYEKFNDKGEKFLRFEVEIKQKLAKEVFKVLVENGMTPAIKASVLHGEYSKLPLVNDPTFLALGLYLQILTLRLSSPIWNGKKAIH